MYAGPFFLLTSVIFYCACHWVASRTSSRTNEMYFKNILFDCRQDQILDAIGSWVGKNHKIQFYKNDEREIIIESKADWDSFGGFYFFRFSKAEQYQQVSIACKPKLIGDTNEQENFLRDFKRHILKEVVGTQIIPKPTPDAS